jgi:hypothetical protein
MNIAVFFYLLDALQGERKDRSVLFWKSMPVSDTTTVSASCSRAGRLGRDSRRRVGCRGARWSCCCERGHDDRRRKSAAALDGSAAAAR